MSSVPTRPTPDAPPSESVEQRFRRLEAIWDAETLYFSDTTRIVNHPAFREIVALGWAVVPYMLNDLLKRPTLWVWALPEITGAHPVPPSDRGNITKMSEAWLRWGRENGYPCEKESNGCSQGCGERPTG